MGTKPQPEIPERVVNALKSHRECSSLLVSGYVDSEAKPREAKLFPQVVLLGGDGGYLSFSSVETTGMLCVDEVSDSSLPNALLDEPSIQPIFVDLSLYYLCEMRAIKFEAASLYLDPGLKDNRHLFRAVAFRWMDGKTLFLDPFWTYGIRIGNEADLARFQQEEDLRPVTISL